MGEVPCRCKLQAHLHVFDGDIESADLPVNLQGPLTAVCIGVFPSDLLPHDSRSPILSAGQAPCYLHLRPSIIAVRIPYSG